MTAEPTPLDVDECSDIVKLIDEARAKRHDLLLRHNGQGVAVLHPLLPPRAASSRVVTPEDLEAFMSAAGAWADVDTDRLIADICADRDQDILDQRQRALPPR